jgi:ABC-type dipeptide/oligopeptide/nickel transport system permease subunit
VQSAIIMGQHPLRIMLIQILPNITGPLLVSSNTFAVEIAKSEYT